MKQPDGLYWQRREGQGKTWTTNNNARAALRSRGGGGSVRGGVAAPERRPCEASRAGWQAPSAPVALFWFRVRG